MEKHPKEVYVKMLMAVVTERILDLKGFPRNHPNRKLLEDAVADLKKHLTEAESIKVDAFKEAVKSWDLQKAESLLMMRPDDDKWRNYERAMEKEILQ